MGKEATNRDIESVLAELLTDVTDAIDAGRDEAELIAAFLLYVEFRRKLTSRSA